MAAKYVLVASMAEGQIEATARNAAELLDLRDEFLRNPACEELAMYRLVAIEEVTAARDGAGLPGVRHLHPSLTAGAAG